MWLLKGVTSDQTSLVKKLLEEEWEPFSASPVKKKGKTVFKLYFKKWEGVMPNVMVEEAKPQMDIEELIDRFGEKFVASLKEVLNEPLEEEERNIPLGAEWVSAESSLSERRSIELENDEESETEIKRIEVEGNTKVDIDEDRIPVKEGKLISGDTPEGDGFRVIDEAPTEITSATARTITQEEAIEQLRRIHGNITIFSPGQDGFVKVLAEEYEYMVAPDGKWSKRDTGANTSSQVIG